MSIDEILFQALTSHKQGRLQEAERLYHAILDIQPNHPDVNHNLGILKMQAGQPAAALPYFKAALDSNWKQGQFWLSYINALTQTGSNEEARKVLELGRKQGLGGEAVDSLGARLERVAETREVCNQEGMHRLPPTSPVIDQTQKKSKSKNKTVKAGRLPRKSITHRGLNPVESEINELLTLFNQRQYTEAVSLAQSMTERFPKYGQGWGMLGVILKQMGRNHDALVPMQKSVALSPEVSHLHSNLAVLLQEVGRLGDAETSCRRALHIMPDFADAHYNLGNILKEVERLDEAEASYRRALELKPDYSEAHNNLGCVLDTLKRTGEAEASYRRALELKPDFAEAHSNLGNALRGIGHLEDAVACYRRALELKPDFIEAHSCLGIALREIGQLKDAVACYRRALELKPEFAEAHNNLGNVMQDLGQFEDAVASYQRALELKPDFAEAHNNLGYALQNLGQFEDAVANYQRALELKPDYAEAYGNLLFTLNYHPDLSAEDVYRAYQEFDTVFGIPLRSTWHSYSNDKTADRRLRVGYVSPDFRDHSCRSFLEPLLAHHDKTKVEVYAYAELSKEDGITTRYRNYVEHWILSKGMSNEALAERIRRDGIDILVDLAGHTIGNRLLTFARKPAPVSLSWLGYGYTTGLSAIDYYLTDKVSVPAGSEYLFSEQPWRITNAICYQPTAGMGEVNGLPALQRGFITFGTLSRSVRINHHTISVWSDILNKVEGSRLVIDSGNFRDSSMQSKWAAMFEAHGIDRARLDIGCHSPPWDVLRGIDIGLDCFPHNSGTTLIESLYLGVPYITLAERPSVGRIGSSVLQTVGHPEWIANNKEEYVTKAVELASDLERLAMYRASLRTEIERSPIRDESGFARKVEEAYRQMWQRWCAGDE